jgi:hypothetical protein
MKWGIERSEALVRLSNLPVCGGAIGRQYDRFLRLKYEVNWHWAGNPASSRSFHRARPELNPVQERLVEELSKTGIAKCHFGELFQDQALWRSLEREVSEFSGSDAVQSAVRQRQRDFDEKRDVRAVEHYIINRYPQDRKPLITADSTLLNLYLNPLILDVANSYLDLWSKLIYFDMWHTLPLNTSTRFLSQRWHRDPEDRRKIRTFLYFSEVDESAGAMEYYIGSHYGGPYEQVFKWADPLETPYPPDGEVERQIPASKRVILEGPPGTLYFCDTAGFHRGGTTKSRPRILATSAYVTPASLHHRRFEIDSTVRAAPWTQSARFAVL